MASTDIPNEDIVVFGSQRCGWCGNVISRADYSQISCDIRSGSIEFLTRCPECSHQVALPFDTIPGKFRSRMMDEWAEKRVEQLRNNSEMRPFVYLASMPARQEREPICVGRTLKELVGMLKGRGVKPSEVVLSAHYSARNSELVPSSKVRQGIADVWREIE